MMLSNSLQSCNKMRFISYIRCCFTASATRPRSQSPKQQVAAKLRQLAARICNGNGGNGSGKSARHATHIKQDSLTRKPAQCNSKTIPCNGGWLSMQKMPLVAAASGKQLQPVDVECVLNIYIKCGLLHTIHMQVAAFPA